MLNIKVKELILNIFNSLKQHTIWKIILFIQVCLVCFLNFGGLMSEYQIAESNVLINWLLTFSFIFVLGYFYSLAFNKCLYSLKVSNLVILFILLNSLLLFGYSFISTLPLVMAQTKINIGENVSDAFVKHISMLRTLLYYIGVYFLINMPIVIAYFRYKKRFNNLDSINKPYLKLFLTYFSLMAVIDFIYLAIFLDKSMLNSMDYLYLCCYLVVSLILILYAYNLKLGKQLIWKIVALPFAILIFSLFFFGSEHFMMLSRFALVTESFVALIAGAIVTALFAYVYYRFAFTNDVY